MDPISNIASHTERSTESKSIMQSLEDAGRLNSTKGQNVANGIKSSIITKQSKNSISKFFEIRGLADSIPVFNRGTIVVNRQRINTRTKTNRVNKLPRKQIRRHSQDRMERSMSKGLKLIRIRRNRKPRNIWQNRYNPMYIYIYVYTGSTYI